ncbi:MAG: hypothetical protein J7495_00155 [Sphingomonas sp.]|nr:hypothetical protein [Sphingomonas sp.]
MLLLWGLAGCLAVYAHIAYGPAMDPKATDWDRAYYAALPGWFVWDFVLAVGGGLLGAVALLLRSRWATLLALLSVAGVVIQFGYVFGMTGLLAHKGAAATVPFPAFILAVALFEWWFARLASRRGWAR